MRKLLHGLDYIAEEGAKAFDDLISILERLGDNGASREMISSCVGARKTGKQYIKTDCKVSYGKVSRI